MTAILPPIVAPAWVDVHYLETTDRVLGGLAGVTNVPTKALHERSEYLKKGFTDLAAIDGAALVGSAAWYAPTITGFNATNVPNGATVIFSGRNAQNDGGGGAFIYNDASAQAADAGLVFAPTGGGRLFRTGWTIFGFQGDVKVAWFGALGGVTNDTTAIQAAINYCATVGLGLTLDNTYSVSKVRLKTGLKYLRGGGLVCIDASVMEAVVEFDGPYFGGTDAANAVLDTVVIDGGGIAPRGAFISTGVGQKIINCRIKNLIGANSAADGIFIREGSTDVLVCGNTIEMPVVTVDNALVFGVYVAGSYNTQRNLDAFNGYATLGYVPRTALPTKRVTVIGNTIKSGYYAVAMDGADDCIVSQNECLDQHWRGIALGDSLRNLIAGNKIIEPGTQGIHISYGSNNNTIQGNKILRTGANTVGNYEGAIQAYIDCHNNDILDNEITSTNRFGIYLGCDVSGNKVKNNRVNGSSVGGIALESEWDAAKPAGAIYSRVSTGPNAAQPSFSNVIKGNSIDVIAGGCPLVVTSLNTIALYDNEVSGNDYNNAGNHNIYFFAENAGSFYRQHLIANKLLAAAASASKYYFSAGRGMLQTCENNSIINERGTATAFTNLDTTPDVSSADFHSALYTAPTTITNFDGGAPGQEITIQGNSNTTIANNANIVCKNGLNVALSGSAINLIVFRNAAGTWVEISRNF